MATALRTVGHEDRLSLVEHLTELRVRIVICLVAFGVATGLCMWQNQRVLDILNDPLTQTVKAGTADPIQQGEGRTIALGVSVEAVEQFQVETSGTGVEFNGQGAENYTIKSGKNEFHGSAFEYLRNTVLDARGFFPSVRPVEHQNEFGFTLGGPIVKKRAFFFFSYDGWRYRVTSPTQLVSVPTLRMR